jgi:hypothetical protein
MPNRAGKVPFSRGYNEIIAAVGDAGDENHIADAHLVLDRHGK